MRNKTGRIHGSLLRGMLWAGALLATGASAAITDGYADNPCTGKFLSIKMIYNTTNTANKGLIIWADDRTGPLVEYVVEMTCQDGQYRQETVRAGADYWVPGFYNATAYATSGGIHQPQPTVTLEADGRLAFRNGWDRGVFTVGPRYGDQIKGVQASIVRYWKNQAARDTQWGSIQTWSSPNEAQTAINTLPEYVPSHQNLTNAYSRLYPAYPWINNGDVPGFGSGGLWQTPRPMVRINYTGPTGTPLPGGGPPPILCHRLLLPGPGRQ